MFYDLHFLLYLLSSILSLLDYPPSFLPLLRFTSLSFTYQISRYATFTGRIIQGTHHPRVRGHIGTQSVQSSELGPSLPHPQASWSPPPLWFRGRDTLACGKGVGGPHSDEGTDTLVIFRYMSMYFVIVTFRRFFPPSFSSVPFDSQQ